MSANEEKGGAIAPSPERPRPTAEKRALALQAALKALTWGVHSGEAYGVIVDAIRSAEEAATEGVAQDKRDNADAWEAMRDERDAALDEVRQRDAVHILANKVLREHGIAPGNAAESRPLSPSSSTPPAPDLPQEQLKALRAAALEEVRAIVQRERDAEARTNEHLHARENVEETRLAYSNGALAAFDDVLERLPSAAQRPPDPAAPDLRDIARDARWVLTGHAVSEEARLDLLARIDAALDEKQVGAAPHSPEER